MTEIVIDTDAGKRRRLPSWMLRMNSEDVVRNLQNGDETSSIVKKQPNLQCSQSRLRFKPGKRSKTFLTQDIDGSDDLETIEVNKAKERSRKASKRDLDTVSLVTSCSKNKIKQKKESEGTEISEVERPALKKQKRKVGRPRNSQLGSSPGGSQEEIELTVEDLLCIAEEYVHADTEQQCSTVRKSGLEACSLGMSIFSEVDTPRTLHSTGSSKTLVKCTTKTSSSKDTEMTEKKSLEIENFASSIARTGDAAQDMLNLFLGPLLCKTAVKEPEIAAVIPESMSLTYETNKHVRKEIWKEETIFTKKKSSLKDKVSVLLD